PRLRCCGRGPRRWLFGDREAKTGAAVRLLLRLPETIEYVGQVFSSNAGAGVFDGERHPAFAGEGRHPHAAALGSELDRVADQVREDLRDTLAIGQDVWKGRRGGHLERYSSSGG